MPTYRIKIVRADSQIEVEGDKKFVLAVVGQYAGTSQPVAAPVLKKGEVGAAPRAAAALPGTKNMSVGEFVRQFGFKKHTDLVVAFGFYLEKISGVQSFTRADINACYYDAKLESSNTSQMITQNVRRGFIMAAKSPKDEHKQGYVLTRSGEEFIEKSKQKTEK